jgi:hypothetical protein|tara:strand:- start:272 stop:1117 length:846 start_codon:yes stop_codon:yes gene_type:complete
LKIDRDALLEKGLGRGVCLSAAGVDFTDFHLPKIQAQLIDPEDIIIPILYDCALLDIDLDREPWLEFVVAKKVASPIPALLNGKTPRKLHFPIIVDGQEIFYEVIPRLQCRSCRSIISELNLAFSHLLATRTLIVLLDWLSNRIKQPVLPDEFEKRLHKKKLENIFKSVDALKASGIYINIDPNEPISVENEYTAKIIVAYEDSVYRELYRAKSVENVVIKLKSYFSVTDGVNLTEIISMPESEITLSILNNFQSWGSDYFTYRSDNPETEGPSYKAPIFT